jgi:hypothetical protein
VTQPSPEESGQDRNNLPGGHPAVDEVLASLDGLDDRPVDEHVAVFESAHDRLRAVLSQGGDQPSRA